MPFATDRRRRIDAMIDYFGEGRARAPWSGLPSQHEDDRRRGPGLGEVDVWVVKVLGPDDADGAERLVERCGDLVYRWALCLTGVKEDAEEVAEEVLRTPADLIHTFASPSAFGSWLFRAGAHAAYQKLRHREP